MRNPFSGSGAVVNWPDVLVAESNPAIQITNNADYSCAGVGTDSVHPELRGSIVVYLDNGVPDVDIFYVDLLGRRSAMLLASKAEGGSAAPVTPALTAKEKAKAAAAEGARLKAEAAAQKKAAEAAAREKAAAAEAAAKKK